MPRKPKARSHPAAQPLTLAIVLAGVERRGCGFRPPAARYAVRGETRRNPARGRASGHPARSRSHQRWLAAVSPIAAGMTAKRLANVRSDLLAAIKDQWRRGRSSPSASHRLATPRLLCLSGFRAGEPTSACPVWRAMQAPVVSRPRTSVTR